MFPLKSLTTLQKLQFMVALLTILYLVASMYLMFKKWQKDQAAAVT